jgi:tRNA nucleotidyltransferase (CCA-adding enzyme)
MEIFKELLNDCKISNTDFLKINNEINQILLNLKKSIKNNKINANPVLGGSSAKGTILKGDFDCDIFVKFNYSYKKDDISKSLENIMKSMKNKFVKVHGSRDYFQFENKGITYEIIPVLDIKNPSDALNVTDMSPLHVGWIKKKINKNPKIIDEIIITKKFCKSQRLYGAESYIGGFSGHVIDILVVYYGSFQKLLENAINWQKYKIIDVENYNSSNDLNKSKISPLIIIDPVDESRNAAAALSIEKFNNFRKVAKLFIDNPSLKFFNKKEINIDQLKKKANKNTLITINLEALEGKIDVVGGKLLKTYKYILNRLNFFDFIIIDSGWDWNKFDPAIMWFIIDSKKLSKEKERIGPQEQDHFSVEAFKLKHKKCYIKDKRVCSMIKRKYIIPEKLIKDLVKFDYIKERTLKTKVYIV